MFYAIALHLDSHTSRWIETNRSGIACHFPPHITLKGRFSISDSESPTAIIHKVLPLAAQPVFELELSGPKYIGRTLCWLECHRGLVGFDILHTMHSACLHNVSTLPGFESYVPKDFEGQGYRPHATIKWNEEGIFIPDKDRAHEDIRIRAMSIELAVLRYTGDAHRRGVETLKTIPLAEP